MNDDDKFSEMDRRDMEAMSDNTPKPQACPVGEVAQLWDNERIHWYAESVTVTGWEARHIFDAMAKVRDDYKAQLAARDSRIRELEAQVAKLQVSLRAAHEENMALIDELDGDDEL